VPRGGLFSWVASPHYLGEILSFVGYAMMSDLLPVWGNALVVSAYLASRANTTLKWYQREMPLRIPLGWRRLVPPSLPRRDPSRARDPCALRSRAPACPKLRQTARAERSPLARFQHWPRLM
jgi:hypothetical protein